MAPKVNPAPDPTAGRTGNTAELVAALSDAEVRQFIDHWQVRREELHAAGDRYGSWWCSKHVSIGKAELRHRAGSDAADAPGSSQPWAR